MSDASQPGDDLINQVVSYAETALDSFDVSPSQALLVQLAKSECSRLAQSYPKVTTGSSGNYADVNLTGADMFAFVEAAGEAVTARWLRSPEGKTYAGSGDQAKIGPISETSPVIDIDASAATAESNSQMALNRIGVLRTASAADRAAGRGVSLFGLAGASRQRRYPCR